MFIDTLRENSLNASGMLSNPYVVDALVAVELAATRTQPSAMLGYREDVASAMARLGLQTQTHTESGESVLEVFGWASDYPVGSEQFRVVRESYDRALKTALAEADSHLPIIKEAMVIASKRGHHHCDVAVPASHDLWGRTTLLPGGVRIKTLLAELGDFTFKLSRGSHTTDTLKARLTVIW